MNYKTDRIRGEWESGKISNRLKDIISLGEQYVEMEFGKELVITDLMRTQKEQDNIYASNPKYAERPWKSVHQYGRGCDLRVWEFTEEEIRKLENFFNCITYDPDRPSKKTCLVHDVGKGKHFHVQVM